MILILIIVLFLIIDYLQRVIQHFLTHRSLEAFVSTPMLRYDVIMNNKSIKISMDKENVSDILVSKLSDIKNIKFAEPHEIPNAFVTDALSYFNVKPSLKIITTIPDKKYLIFFKKRDLALNESLAEVIRKKKPIGYRTEMEKEIIHMLAQSMGFNIQELNLLKSTDFKEVYTICVWTSFYDPATIKFINDHNSIDFLNYDEYDIHKLKFFAPFINTENKDLSLYFRFHDKDFSVKTLIYSDMVLLGKNSLEVQKNYGLEINILLYQLAKFEIINYYLQYFSFFRHAVEYSRQENRKRGIRHTLNVLEQFKQNKDEMPTFEFDELIRGFYDANLRVFETTRYELEGTPLMVGAIIKLKNQERREENGPYIIVSIYGNQVKMERLDKENKNDYPDEYECYGRDDIKTERWCNSIYDASGVRLKGKRTYWDRRCKTNKDCEFYQANKNFKNYRGGCLDGYCEFPIGVKRVSYRKYEGQPWCHGCKSEEATPECCEAQKDKKQYPNLKSPNYAFPLEDQYHRLVEEDIPAQDVTLPRPSDFTDASRD